MDTMEKNDEVTAPQVDTLADDNAAPKARRGRPPRAKVQDVVNESDNGSALERFLDTATQQVRRLDRERLKRERGAAMDELLEMYGEIQPGSDKKEFTPEVAMAIKDPAHRLMVLAEMANGSWTKSKPMDSLRTKRSAGIQVLHFRYKWKPIKIYRLLEGAHDNRVVSTALASGDHREHPQMSEETAKKLAVDSHLKYMRREENGLFARPKRDELIIKMTEGKGGDKRVWTNAELSRLAKMTTAAVTQIRNGTAPSAKRAARAA